MQRTRRIIIQGSIRTSDQHVRKYIKYFKEMFWIEGFSIVGQFKGRFDAELILIYIRYSNIQLTDFFSIL